MHGHAHRPAAAAVRRSEVEARAERHGRIDAGGEHPDDGLADDERQGALEAEA